jgi:hypothetical protein
MCDERSMDKSRGFPNIALINKSLKELFLRLKPARIRQFTHNFELTSRETSSSEDSVIRAQRIARRLADHYRITVAAVIVHYRSDIWVPGRVELSPGAEFFVEIHSDYRDDIRSTLAILAHEIAHIFLFQSGIQFEPTFHNEVLTDTTAAFLGCGVAILNGAKRTTTTSNDVTTTRMTQFGYISLDEFGYVQAKRDAFFQSTPVKLLNQGLPRSGYRAGRRRFRSECSKPPFVPPSILERALISFGSRNQPKAFSNQKITLGCLFCSQQLRVPILGKKISVHCPVCEEAHICHV